MILTSLNRRLYDDTLSSEIVAFQARTLAEYIYYTLTEEGIELTTMDLIWINLALSLAIYYTHPEKGALAILVNHLIQIAIERRNSRIRSRTSRKSVSLVLLFASWHSSGSRPHFLPLLRGPDRQTFTGPPQTPGTHRGVTYTVRPD